MYFLQTLFNGQYPFQVDDGPLSGKLRRGAVWPVCLPQIDQGGYSSI